jgi:hypothetical protein
VPLRQPSPGRRFATPAASLVILLGLLYPAAVPPASAATVLSAVPSFEQAAGELPRPKKVLQVASGAELEEALAKAAGGDHIVLKDGTYSGIVELTRSFPVGERLVIRAESQLGAKLTGRWRVSGSGIILSGLAWQGENAAVRISGSNVRLTRCAVDGSQTRGAVVIGNQPGETTRSVMVDHCEISRYATDGIDIAPDGTVEDVAILRNYIHDGGGGKGEHNLSGNAIAVGIENGHREKAVRATVAWNLIEGHAAANTIHVKSSENLIAFNTLEKVKKKQTNISVRHGRDNRIIGNTVQGGRISTYDYGTVILANQAKEIWLQAGNIGDDGYSEDELENKAEAGYSTRPASRDAKLAGNDATLVVGQHFKRYCKQQPTPVEGAAIYQHDGEVEMAPEDCVAWYKDVVNKPESRAPEDWGPLPKPVVLTAREVGPDAK